LPVAVRLPTGNLNSSTIFFVNLVIILSLKSTL
jgi:hypothetical protein